MASVFISSYFHFGKADLSLSMLGDSTNTHESGKIWHLLACTQNYHSPTSVLGEAGFAWPGAGRTSRVHLCWACLERGLSALVTGPRMQLLRGLQSSVLKITVLWPLVQVSPKPADLGQQNVMSPRCPLDTWQRAEDPPPPGTSTVPLCSDSPVEVTLIHRRCELSFFFFWRKIYINI